MKNTQSSFGHSPEPLDWYLARDYALRLSRAHAESRYKKFRKLANSYRRHALFNERVSDHALSQSNDFFTLARAELLTIRRLDTLLDERARKTERTPLL